MVLHFSAGWVGGKRKIVFNFETYLPRTMVPGVARRWRGEAAAQRGGGEASLHFASVVRCRPFVRWRRRMAAPSSEAPSAVGAKKYKYEAQKVREARVPYPFYPAFGSAYLLFGPVFGSPSPRRCDLSRARYPRGGPVRPGRISSAPFSLSVY